MIYSNLDNMERQRITFDELIDQRLSQVIDFQEFLKRVYFIFKI